MKISRILCGTFFTGFSILPSIPAEEAQRPNLIIILVDDVGYGDIGCFGGTRAKTPHLDRMAAEGLRLNDFYAHPVCGVTRAALLTGSYAMRVAEAGNKKHGHPILHPKEITIAEVLRKAGYRTGMVGKWHLAGGKRKSYPPELMPNAQGFDSFFGAPLHNGFTRDIPKKGFRMQLMRQNEILDDSVDQSEMDVVTRLYTEESINFIKANKDRPFFLYLAHSMAHVVLGASGEFRGKSEGGLYGDVISELDWSTGEILRTLKEMGIDEKTLVLFTSDNGPWIEGHLKGKGGNDTHYGTAAPLRGAKMMTWEGGVRVPTVVRWPTRIPENTECNEPATIMDLMPTFARLAGATLPSDRKIDGRDILPLLLGKPGAESPHHALYYYAFTHLQAVRSGKWKLVAPRPARPPWTIWSARMIDAVEDFKLYDLAADRSETTDLADKHPDVVERLQTMLEQGRQEIGDYNRIGTGARFFDQAPRRPDANRWKNWKPGKSRLTEKAKASIYDYFKPLGKLRFTFESGGLESWNIVEGTLEMPVSGHTSLPRWKQKPYNREGKFHLSTIATGKGFSDRQTGVIESPSFRLSGEKASLLVSGGFDKETLYVAICDAGTGEILIRAGGQNGPQMHRVVWDVSPYKNRKVILRVVDRHTGAWGHLTIDDFSAAGFLIEK